MCLLVAGILTFAILHLYPGAFPASRSRLMRKLGRNPYRGLFSVLVVAGLVMIVLGWKLATPAALYAPPLRPGFFGILLVFIAFLLLVASQSTTNLRRFVRHPQLQGVVVWSIAHLLLNGDSRSVVLFGGLGIWALLSIALCNRRDGAWQRPQPAPIRNDILTTVFAAAGFALVAYFHGRLFGVPPY